MKVFLAGGERWSNHFTTAKSKYILASFAYLKQKVFEKIVCEDFLLDSGAFTFLSNAEVKMDWKKYVEKYAAFVRANNIKQFFELDIYKIIGFRETVDLRRRLEDLAGRASIPVWHRSLGREYLEKLSSDYNFIGFGGFALKDIKPEEYKFIPQLLKICFQNNCRVHGLGFTNQDALKMCKFYSVDSLSWNGERFGKIYHFRNNRLEHIRIPNRRAKKGVNAHNLQEWVKFQAFADKFL